MQSLPEESARDAVTGTLGLTIQQVAAHEPLWSSAQYAFSVTRSIINLDSARTSPSLRSVTEALVRYIWQQEELPIQQWERISGPRVATVRVGLARLFGCEPEEIAIVRNSTEALQAVLLGVDLKPGDEVLSTTQDYGSMLAALNYREQREGIKVTTIDIPAPPASMDELVAAFEQAMTPRTRLILVCHMVNLTGQIFPIRHICEIAHERGIDVVVDGAQSFGHLDFKQQDLGCDYFGASLHKYFGAPRGTGILFIRKDKIAGVKPLMGGALGNWQSESIGKFESAGIQSVARLLAIDEALTFHDIIGPAQKTARLYYLKQYWMERLQRLPSVRFLTRPEPEMSCGIATFKIDGIDSRALGDYLWERHRIQITVIYQFERAVRVSPNLFNTLNELDCFCEAIENVVRNGLPEDYKNYEPKRRRR